VYNVEHGIEDGAGNRRWLSINAAPLSIADTAEWGVLAVVKDITERHQEAQTLKTLHERTQAMARTENREAIAGIATETMDELLGFDGTVMYRFDGTDSLVPLEWSAGVDAAVDEPATVTRESGYLWSVFVEGEPTFLEDLAAHDGQPHDLPLQSAFVLPVGNHGILLTGTSTPSTLPTTKREAAHLIQNNLDAALDRADREQRLRERDRALQRQNEQLEQLNRLNTIIRETTAAVIQSASRDDIERRVCEQIAAGAEYSFAWIGGRDESTGQLDLYQYAEMDPEYAEYLGSRDGTTPLTEMVETAMRDGTVQVSQQILEQPAWKPHRSDVLTQAYRSVAVVPIVVQDRVESVLVIHGRAPELFDEREQAVLEELGDAIGYAVANLDDGATLDDGTRTEIELLISDEGLFSNQLAAALDVDIELAGAIAGEPETVRTFVRFPPLPEDVVDRALADLTFVVDSQRLTGTEETTLYQITLDTPRLVRSFRANGVRLRSLSVENEQTTVTAVLSGDVRPVVEAVQAEYPQTELQARRDGIEPVDTRSTFRDRILEDLTQKQFDAFQTALYGGFYEWPRTSTREELAATRDIASSTFSHHLRAAERKLLTAVLDSV
jgi:predicted DNA binding protein/transcriptional regulator with GAF, ATPase, and Fis domain